MVEGQTEYEFVRRILAPYLALSGLYMTPTLTKTDRAKGFKGGVVSYGKVKNDIQFLLRDTNAAVVTTMIDFYHLPTSFPGYKTLPKGTCYQRVAHLETAIQKDINHRRFLPYFALHEFEALLFTSPELIANTLSKPEKVADLQKIRAEYTTPEEINEKDAPSKHLMTLLPGYRKQADGLAIASEIGIERIRQACSHFNDWLQHLENIGN